jgi:hypothetical protein
MTAMRKTIAVLAATTGATVLVTGAGLAAASARPASSGTEHFSLMTTQPSARKYTVIASGVFTAGGVDTSGNTTDTARFANGSFKIHHGGKFKILKEQVNEKTCLAVFEAKASITLGSGTGAYKGISGSGSALINEVAIFRRTKGSCNPNVNPLVNEQTITATAHVKL